MIKKKGFGRIIRESRDGLALTQRELAARIGVTDSYCAHLEREVKLPSLKASMAMASVFGWSDEEHAAFLEAVDDERARRSDTRIRTRGMAVRGALLNKPSGGDGQETLKPPGAAQVSRELAADPRLARAYRQLSVILSDPILRETILQTLETFSARATESASQTAKRRPRTR